MGRVSQIARKPVTWVVVGVVVVVAGVALALTQPWKLFIAETVDEALPVAAGGVTADDLAGPTGTAGEPADGAADGEPAAPPTPPGPTTLSSAEFVSAAHPTSGTAVVLELDDGSRYVRFEGLDTDNGPDLQVYLSTTPVGASDDEIDADPGIVDLGGLKGNIGDQNYELAPDVDLGSIRSVVIWCERFTVSFGAAEIAVAP